MTTHARLELNGPMETGFDEVLTPDALEFVAELRAPRSARAAEELLEARRGAGERAARRGRCSTSCPRPREIRDGDWTVAPVAARPAAALGRDHRPDRPQDDDQRAELGRRRVHGRLRGRQRADLAQHGRRPAQPPRRDRRARSPTTTPTAGTTSWRENPATLLVRPRGWHLPERHLLVDSEPVVRLAVRLRPVLLPLRAARCCGNGTGAVLLPAQDGVAPRGAAVERRVRLRPGGARASRAGRSRPPC